MYHHESTDDSSLRVVPCARPPDHPHQQWKRSTAAASDSDHAGSILGVVDCLRGPYLPFTIVS